MCLTFALSPTFLVVVTTRLGGTTGLDNQWLRVHLFRLLSVWSLCCLCYDTHYVKPVRTCHRRLNGRQGSTRGLVCNVYDRSLRCSQTCNVLWSVLHTLTSLDFFSCAPFLLGTQQRSDI